MFSEERSGNRFAWADLGDIDAGRPNLGAQAPVWAYRLLEYTLRDVLIAELGVGQANDILRRAGKLAGVHFCGNRLDRQLPFSAFVAQLQRELKESAIGIVRVEKADLENMAFTLVVAEDLDCSGLPFSDEVVCQYDEGFIGGILETYVGRPFSVREVDCWASGERVCRFEVRQVKGDA